MKGTGTGFKRALSALPTSFAGIYQFNVEARTLNSTTKDATTTNLDTTNVCIYLQGKMRLKV